MNFLKMHEHSLESLPMIGMSQFEYSFPNSNETFHETLFSPNKLTKAIFAHFQQEIKSSIFLVLIPIPLFLSYVTYGIPFP